MGFVRYWLAELKGRALRKKQNVLGHCLTEDKLEVYVTEKYSDRVANTFIADEEVSFSKRDIVPKKVRIGFKTYETDVVEAGHVVAQGLKGGEEIAPLGVPREEVWVGTLGIIGWREAVNTGRKIVELKGMLSDKVRAKIADEIIRVPYALTNGHVVRSEYNDLNSAISSFSQPYGDLRAAYNLEEQSKDLGLDAALLQPLRASAYVVEGSGLVEGVQAPSRGMKCQKTGRTTGFTEGTILRTGASLNVDYGGKTGLRLMRNCVTLTPMSKAGDSGSAILWKDEEGKLWFVAHLFAGSSQLTIGQDARLATNKFNLKIGR